MWPIKNDGKSMSRRATVYLLWFSVLCLCMAFTSVFASDCEVVRSRLFEKQQDVIVTDWHVGVAYRKIITEVYPCADITLKNTHWQALKSKDIEVTATFADQSTKAKKPECENRLLEPNEEFSCSVCFESVSPISRLECRFK
jgi:hypothetical protein